MSDDGLGNVAYRRWLEERQAVTHDNLKALVVAVRALDAAAADHQPYQAWDAAKWAVFNAAVRFVKESADA